MAKRNLRLQRPSSHAQLLSRIAVWDVAWSGISPALAYLLRDGTIHRFDAVAIYCGIALLSSLLVFQGFRTSSPIARFYTIRDAFGLLKACALVAAISAVAAFLLTRLEDAPRSIPVLHFMLMASVLLGSRMLLRLRATYRESNRLSTNDPIEHVIIIEATRLAWFFSKMVEELAPTSCQIVAILDQRARLKSRTLNGYPIVGEPTELEKVIADYAMHGVRIDKVVLASQPDDLPTIAWEEVCRSCRALGIDLEVLPERLMAKEASAAQPAPIIAAPLSDGILLGNLGLDRPFWKVKRATDIALALVFATVLSPIILAVSVLVALDGGFPIVFWQRRLGRNGLPLHLYKFRTLQTLFDRQTKEKRETQKTSPLARLLQRTRLDELPQLWNVLSGDMSLIGPRPLLPIDQPQGPSLRLAIRPGVTGWAQTCGGKLITVEEKNALDEWYIRHATYWLDITIIARTIKTLLMGDRRDEKAIAAALGESVADNKSFVSGNEAGEIVAQSTNAVTAASNDTAAATAP